MYSDDIIFQAEYQQDLFKFIFETKFLKFQTPEEFLRAIQSNFILKAFKYFQLNPVLDPGHENYTVADDASLDDKFCNVMLSADALFKSNIFTKIDKSLGPSMSYYPNLISIESSLCPTFKISGSNYG